MAQRKASKGPKIKKTRANLVITYPNAAGIDIGSAAHFVAVPPDRDNEPVREFPSFTTDLSAIADWFSACGVDVVAMESTGVYWIPLFELLESRGFKVLLVNARHVKNVSGRKSDVLDCQWLQQLMTYGLLSGAFRPEEQVCVLRSFMRQRTMLLKSQATHVQHMQKALTQMNIQLANVISDVAGETGQKILRAILAGERDGRVLVEHAEPAAAEHAVEVGRLSRRARLAALREHDDAAEVGDEEAISPQTLESVHPPVRGRHLDVGPELVEPDLDRNRAEGEPARRRPGQRRSRRLEISLGAHALSGERQRGEDEQCEARRENRGGNLSGWTLHHGGLLSMEWAGTARLAEQMQYTTASTGTNTRADRRSERQAAYQGSSVTSGAAERPLSGVRSAWSRARVRGPVSRRRGRVPRT